MFNYNFEGMTHQFIDAYGKMRGLIFNNISIFFPPVQPLNLPQTRAQTYSSIETVIQKFQPNSYPVAISVENSYITGLWYSIFDIEQGIYVAVDPRPLDSDDLPENIKNLPFGDPHPMESAQDSLALRYKRMQKSTNIYLQTVIWIYQLFEDIQNTQNPEIFNNLSLNQQIRIFVNQYMIIGQEDIIHNIDDFDSSELYNVDKVPINFWPNITDPNIVLQKLKDIDTKMVISFQNTLKLYAYNKWFLSKIVYSMYRFFKSKLPSLKLKQIVNNFQGVIDFKHQNETIIIIGEADFKEWLNFQERLKSNFEDIHTKINIDFRFKVNPYIYHDIERNRYFIVQNVVNNDKARALAVCLKWQKDKINIGSVINPILNIEQQKYVVYGISGSTKQLFLRSNKSQGSTDYLELLEYGRRDITNFELGSEPQVITEYAAMLPIPNPHL